MSGSTEPLDSLQSLFEAYVPNVDPSISPGERMPADDPAYYLSVGQGVLRLVKLALLHSLKRPASIRHILDLPCGHGRVLRTLRAAFPSAEITASDLLEDGVDFCAKTFNATPVLSKIHPTPDLFPHAGQYDLIFVGSLFTHLDEPRWFEFLSLFHALLAPNGILLFTTHGPYVAFRMISGETYGYLDRHAPPPHLPLRTRLGPRPAPPLPRPPAPLLRRTRLGQPPGRPRPHQTPPTLPHRRHQPPLPRPPQITPAR
ncbi:MAG TPA: class I SAM-dependent methyltransferase [Phycisphaerae bacterium]|nr:class I SAM-dependent methyltransferase [Phycisphaerae bacterium]